jgi:regulatory protein
MASALSEALKILSRRMQTAVQLETKLRLKKYPKTEITDAIEKLKSWNYINDQEYVRAFCRVKAGKYSRARVKQELLLAGIKGEIISELLSELYSEDEEYLYLKKIVAKYLQEEKHKTGKRKELQRDSDIQQKIGQRLFRQGYPYGSIQKAIEESDNIY